VRRIAVIAATLAVLSGCGGEDRTKASQPERAGGTDWRTLADAACGRATDALVARGWGSTLKDLKRHLPGVADDVRAGIDEIRRLPGRPDQQFVADMDALAPRFTQLARASRTLKIEPMDRAISGLGPRLRAAAGSARRAGLEQCLQQSISRTIVNVLRAPVAAEQLARIEAPITKRFRAAKKQGWPDGPRAAVAALDDENVAFRALKVPTWVRRERAAYLAAARAYRRGLQEVLDRYDAGLDTSHARFEELVTRRGRRTDRMMRRLWEGIGANPVS
jgi:hypothetical protein